jgi:hypothetical protein
MAESAPPDDVMASEPVTDDPTRPRSDASVATNVIVNSPIEILPESKEIYVYVEICAPPENPKGNIPVMKYLKGFLWTIWNCYTPGVIMYDKDNKHISKSAIEGMKTLPQFTKMFTSIYMINFALKQGKSFARWQKVVNIMLEKEPGNPKIHRLQVIHLYEADYNLILALKARKLVHNAEDNGLLNKSLYGARPGRMAHDPVGLEEFVGEITRLSRKPCIKNAEDATACYDRIIPGVGNLASRAFGMHRFVALVQGKTLEEVRYHLKTKLGISDENYKHCDIYPIYGTGQGSGNSPTVWLVISSILFDCYESKAFGATFESPDRTLRLRLFRAGFVDDTTS